MRRLATLAVLLPLALPACGEDEKNLGAAPDVRGLPLPAAKKVLKRADYRPTVKSEAVFGVIIEENFTVCDQDTPRGRLVPITVDKYC